MSYYRLAGPFTSSYLDGLKGQSGAQYGMPDGEDMYIEIPSLHIAQSSYEAVTLELECIVSASASDALISESGSELCLIYVSTDGGVTYPKAGVMTKISLSDTAASFAFGSTTYNDALKYKITSNNILSVVPDGATVTNIRIYPFGCGNAKRISGGSGGIRVLSIKSLGYSDGEYRGNISADTVSGIVLSNPNTYGDISGGVHGVISSDNTISSVTVTLRGNNNTVLNTETVSVGAKAFGLYHNLPTTNAYIASSFANVKSVTVTADGQTLLTLSTATPAAPTALAFSDEFRTVWKGDSSADCFRVILKKNGSSLSSVETSDFEYDFSSVIRENGVGVYSVEVSAKYGSVFSPAAGVSKNFTAGIIAPDSESKALFISAGANAAWRTNSTGNVYNYNATINNVSGFKYQQNSASSGATGGVPFEFILDGLSISKSSYSELTFDLYYGYIKNANFTDIFIQRKAYLSVSTDNGITYKTTTVPIIRYENTGLGIVYGSSSSEAAQYRIVSDDILKVVGDGETIINIILRPFGDEVQSAGFFRVVSVALNGYTGNAYKEPAAVIPDEEIYIQNTDELRAKAVTQIKMIASSEFIPSGDVLTANATYPDAKNKVSHEAMLYRASWEYFQNSFKYLGPIYNRAYKSTYEQWSSVITGGVYTGANNLTSGDDSNGDGSPDGTNAFLSAYGMDCASLVYEPLGRISPVLCVGPEHFVTRSGFAPIGGLDVTAILNDDTITDKMTAMTANNPEQLIYSNYAAAKNGDAVVRYGSHVRMVTGGVVTNYVSAAGGAFSYQNGSYVYVGAGNGTHNIDPGTSYMYTTETAATLLYKIQLTPGGAYYYMYEARNYYNQDSGDYLAGNSYATYTVVNSPETTSGIYLRVPLSEILADYPNMKIVSGSSCRIDKKYTFTDLRDTCYIVTSLLDFEDKTFLEQIFLLLVKRLLQSNATAFSY